MRILGYEVSRVKAPVEPVRPPVMNWDWLNKWDWTLVSEPFTGAWQRNQEVRLNSVLCFYAVYSCVTLIAQDIGKLRLRIVQEIEDDVYEETDVPAFSPILRRPNHFQTRQKFIESWVTSKLTTGNTYVLKERDNRNTVSKLYILNPVLTRPLVAEDGSVWYQLAQDKLAGLNEPEMDLIVPASEIIHDVMTPLYHPLCGVSPIMACGLAALQGLNMQNTSNRFFENGAKPSGILTAPGPVSTDTLKAAKEQWEANYSGTKTGKVAVLADGLKYESIAMTAADAQLINQLKWTAENVCTAFHVPPHKISIGQQPNYNNIEALDQQYYAQCLQTLMEAIENLLDEGLGLERTGTPYCTEFNLDDLLKMDTSTQIKTYGEAVARGIFAPNEARKKLGYGKVKGGDTPYLQQQNFSLAALDKRDSKEDPFASKTTGTKPAVAPGDQTGNNNNNNLPPPEPQRALPPPSANWETDELLKGLRYAAR